MSTPCALSGEEDESTSNGRPERPADAGNVTSSAAIVDDATDSADDALQGTGAEGGARMHDPGNTGGAGEDAQHTHAGHPKGAVGEQQQLPRHESEAQSYRDAHGSPGGRRKHEPSCREQPRQPAVIAAELQHAPSKQRAEAHEEDTVHGLPSGRGGRITLGSGDGVKGWDAAVVGVGAMDRVIPEDSRGE